MVVLNYTNIPGDADADRYTKQVLLLGNLFGCLKVVPLRPEIQIPRDQKPRG
jgi:hypothetical protein